MKKTSAKRFKKILDEYEEIMDMAGLAAYEKWWEKNPTATHGTPFDYPENIWIDDNYKNIQVQLDTGCCGCSDTTTITIPFTEFIKTDWSKMREARLKKKDEDRLLKEKKKEEAVKKAEETLYNKLKEKYGSK